MLEARRSSIILNSSSRISSAWSTGSLQLEGGSKITSAFSQQDEKLQRETHFLTPSRGLIGFVLLLISVGVVVAVLMLTKKEERQVFSCKFHQLIGDGICHDATNIELCDFDGGDCCLEQINTSNCMACQCLQKSTNST